MAYRVELAKNAEGELEELYLCYGGQPSLSLWNELAWLANRSSLSGSGERRLAGSTGLEPAASGVTGRRSNQLNYDPMRTITLQFSECRFQIGLSIQPAISICNLKSAIARLLIGRYRIRTCDSRRVKPVLYH